MGATLTSDVVRRLDADASLAPEVAELVLAALLGEIEECLCGKSPAREKLESRESTAPSPAYVGAITVEGFRGIGPPVRLELTPGPGLTLVVGRNGSGKSSFAEALELLLTGDNQRWSRRRSTMWKNGWRNLHAPELANIQADFLLDGVSGPMTLGRSWPSGEELTGGTTTLSRNGRQFEAVGMLGWEQSMANYRPFLSYSELGSMLEDGPTKLFDALAAVVGLEELVQATEALAAARRARVEAHKATAEKLAEKGTERKLKAAEDWLRQTASDIRNERFQPMKQKVKRLWGLLRTQGSVDLYDVTFEGVSSDRRVNLGVRIDGAEGDALGVMSQGDLHSLALSLFLPRATLKESPFRFLFIDDPVQAMDAGKVDGLARVLAEVARERQVVVFTHDSRLLEAVHHLSVEATVIEVQRHQGSLIELRTLDSPVRHYLDDAWALMKTDELPKHAYHRVVPGLCRHGLEAACREVIRRRYLTRGDSHAAVERLIDSHRRLFSRLALVFFDDPARAGEVLQTLNKRYGDWSSDVVIACNEGSHTALESQGMSFVKNSEKLAHALLGLS